MKYIDTDYYPPAGCMRVNAAYLEGMEMPIILCDKEKFSTELMVDTLVPSYYGTTIGGCLNYIVYVWDFETLIVVYKSKVRLPKGQEADYKCVERRQKTLLRAKENGVSGNKWTMLTQRKLDSWIKTERERYHVGGD